MLKISNVETFYGKIQALRGVDIEVNDGEIVSLIGSNGAGKSTLLMTISGVNKAKRGNIVFNGENIEDKQPHKIVDMGICQVPEGRRIFSRLTVEENLRLGAHANEKGKHYENDIKEVGYKYQMTDIAATMGCDSLDEFDFILKHRQKIYNTYLNELSSNKKIKCIEVILAVN